MRTTLLSCLTALTAAVAVATAAPYSFLGGHNVLDEGNSPGIGTNLAATVGLERGIAVDEELGIAYISRGPTSIHDGRSSGVAGAVAAIIITNGFGGSSYTDTGLINENTNDVFTAGFGPNVFVQAPVFIDKTNNRVLVLGRGTAVAPVVYSAPRGTLGGAPSGGDPSALNRALIAEFEIPNDLLDPGTTNSFRAGTGRGFAGRTAGGVTTLYLAMGNHVQAWSNDATNGAPQFPWRRVWATHRAPSQNTTDVRLPSSSTLVSGVAVDDEGNCYFTVAFSDPARIWRVPADAASSAANPFDLEYDDRILGGANTGPDVLVTPVLPRLPAPAVTLDGTNTFSGPQALSFFRTDGRKGLFVSVLTFNHLTRSVARIVLDEPALNESGYPFTGAAVVDAFGSGAPGEFQDTILRTMRLKGNGTSTGNTQPNSTLATPPATVLYTDPNTVTNPTILYFEAFVTDTNKGQSLPTAVLGMAAIPPLPPAPAVTNVAPASGPVGGGTPVTVTGEHFASGATVSFGGVNSPNVVFNNAGSLTATTPPNPAGAVDVVVTNPDGQRVTVPAAFTYEAAVVPFSITSTVRQGAGAVAITWESVAGRSYEVQFKPAVTGSTWSVLDTVTASGASTSHTNSGLASVSERYYRVVLLP